MSKAVTRRELLRSLLRLLALGSLGALAGRLLVRGKLAPVETCLHESLCRGCAVFARCGLPQALSARQRAPWAAANGGRS